MTRPIFFLTDFGLADIYVGVVRAVILGIAPDARIVDLTHDVPPHDVRAGAFALLAAAQYLPDDAVVLAVVDPGVGTSRRPIALHVSGRTYVGPDNGLFSWVTGADLDVQPTLPGRGSGGAETVVVLDRPEYWRPAVSSTFHGRDLFGPVAAHLARGVPLQKVGSACDRDTRQRLRWPPVFLQRGADGHIVEVQGEIVHIDRFGNLIANLGLADLPTDPVLDVAGRRIDGFSPHFQPATGAPGDLIALIGSTSLLEIAVPNGSAAELLGVGIGAVVVANARA
jgi:S-adenosylmethionine hydrolase